MFRSDLKLTICYLSCFLQERKLVFSQGGFCPENSLFPRIDVCGTKVKLQLQLHRLSEAIPNISIVLGFPKSCARARFFVYSPPLGWHMYFAMCRSWSPHDTWRLYMCHAGTSSDTWQNTCAAWGGGYTQENCARAHDFGETQIYPKQWSLRSNACAFLWHLHFLFHTEPRIEGLGPQWSNPKWRKYGVRQKTESYETAKKKYREVYACAYKEHEMNWLQLICSISSEISN